MSYEVITAPGKTVTPFDDATKSRGIFGDNAVLAIGEQCRYEIISSNLIRVYDGTYFLQGHQFKIPPNGYHDFTIENGNQGIERYDLIGFRYSNADGGSAIVVKDVGETIPSQGDLWSGAESADGYLYRVKLVGLAIESVEQLFYVFPAGDKTYIAEIGSNKEIRWIKYSDGTMEMWGCLSLPTANLAKTDGYLYYAADSVAFVYPEKFAETPVLQVTTQNSGKAIWAMVESVTTSSASFWLYGVKKEVITGTKVNWHACGRWK